MLRYVAVCAVFGAGFFLSIRHQALDFAPPVDSSPTEQRAASPRRSIARPIQAALAFHEAARADASPRFLTQQQGWQAAVDAAQGLTLALTPPVRDQEGSDEHSQKTIQLRFGSQPGRQLTAESRLPGVVHEYLGADPRGWRTNVATYGRVRCSEAWPGIDVVFYGRGRQLEYDLVAAPGVDPQSVELAVEGADEVRVNEQGDLVLQAGSETLRMARPECYQVADGRRVPIAGDYRLSGGRIAFELGAYDRTLPVVIDPVIETATYLGGGGSDGANDVKLDAEGNILVCGVASHAADPEGGYPAFPGRTEDTPNHVLTSASAYICKFDPSGTTLLSTTFLGGSAGDGAHGMEVAADGSVCVVGNTASNNFPTLNPVQGSYGGGVEDAFVARFSPEGTLVFSTYLGGEFQDRALDLALDAAGNAYVAGWTSGNGTPVFPTTPGAYIASSSSSQVPYLAKLDAAGSLVYSTFLRGQVAYGVAVDGGGNACVTTYGGGGFTGTAGSYQPNWQGANDVIVTKLNPQGTGLVYLTFLGGSNSEIGFAIALDSSGCAYIAGNTNSSNFPVANAAQGTNAGGVTDAFVAKLSADGSQLLYSTYLGGASEDYPFDYYGVRIAVNALGQAHVTGSTRSTDFPTADAIQDTHAGQLDAFVTVLSAEGDEFLFSSFLGGPNDQKGYGITTDAGGAIYVVGQTGDGFPATDNAFQDSYASNEVGYGGGDAFLVKLSQTVELTATKDAFIRNGADNTNEGANPFLRIQSSGHNRALAEFDLSTVSSLPTRATLVFTIADNADNWGTTGRNLQVFPLGVSFAEGNGVNSIVPNNQRYRGDGAGVTWNCAADADISNQKRDGDDWDGGDDAIPGTASDTVLVTNGQSGELHFDVTADVLAAILAQSDAAGWLLRKELEGQNGHVDLHSLEGAAAAQNAQLAPRLILEFGTAP